MKILLYLFLITVVIGSEYELGQIDVQTIEAHKLYKQDVLLSQQFQAIPEIVLSISKFDTQTKQLDFFSRITQVTEKGFQLQIISDSILNNVQFNYFASTMDNIEVICQNAEITKNVFEIQLKKNIGDIPKAIAFLTGVHSKNQENIFIQTNNIENNKIKLKTNANAESSLGFCLLIGPQNLFNINTNINDNNSQELFSGLQSIQINTDENDKINQKLEIVQINFQSLHHENQNSQVNNQQKDNKQDNQQNETIEIDSIKLLSNEALTNNQINSLSFNYIESQYQKYDEQEDLEASDDLATLSESWLQHDIYITENNQNNQEYAQQNNNNDQDLENNNIIVSLGNQPDNIEIMDTTSVIIEQNKINQIDEQINQEEIDQNQNKVIEIDQNFEEQNEDNNEDYNIQQQEKNNEESVLEQKIDDLQEQLKQTQEMLKTLLNLQNKMNDQSINQNSSQQDQTVNNNEQQLIPDNNNQENTEQVTTYVWDNNIDSTVYVDNQIQEQNDNNNEIKVEEQIDDLKTFDKLKQKKDDIQEPQLTDILNSFESELKQITESNQENLQSQITDNQLQNENKDELQNTISSQQNTNELSNNDNEDNIEHYTNNIAESLSFEELSQSIFNKQYEIEEAYFDWQQQSGKSQLNSNTLDQDELQQKIDEFLELDSKEQLTDSSEIFDSFHSFLSVNQKLKKNLRRSNKLNL